MQVILLVALTAVVGTVLVAMATWVIGPGQVPAAVPAVLLCVVGSSVTLLAALWVWRRALSLVAAAALLGAGVRLMTAVAGVMVLRGAVVAAGGSPTRFAEWVAVFYIVTLAIESAILIRSLTAAGPRAGCDDGDRSAPTGR